MKKYALLSIICCSVAGSFLAGWVIAFAVSASPEAVTPAFTKNPDTMVLAAMQTALVDSQGNHFSGGEELNSVAASAAGATASSVNYDQIRWLALAALFLFGGYKLYAGFKRQRAFRGGELNLTHSVLARKKI